MTPPTHAPSAPSSRLGSLGDRLQSTLRRSAASTPSSGWSRHVQAEHLLLEPQPVALVELESRDGDALVEAAVAGVAAEVAEQAHHALVALAAAHERGVDDLLEHHQQALARDDRASRTRRP